MVDGTETPEQTGPEDDTAMSVFEHLAELRTRLIRAIAGIAACAIVAGFFHKHLLEFLTAPLTQAWLALGMEEPKLHFANPIAPFVAAVKIAVVTGFMAASPWVFWQTWKFVAPGLYDREKRLTIPFVLASTVCFLGGSLFGYMVVFPLGFETLLGMSGMLPNQSIDLHPTIMINEYLTFVTRMLLAFGVVFEIPVVVSFLAMAGIVNWRQLLRFGRWWVLLAAVLSALLTPPDVVSQVLMIGPLVLLYFVSVGVAFFLGPRPQREASRKSQTASEPEDGHEAEA